MDKRRVVITGLGTVNPLGNNVADSWAAARAGKCGIGPITQFDTTDFKCKLAGEVKGFDPETVVDKKEVRKMARFTLLALGAAAEAIADSGLDTEAEGKDIGVILSSGIGGLPTIEEQHARGEEKGMEKVSPYFVPEILKKEILRQYRSVRQFAMEMNIPYSTLVTALERGIEGMAYGTVIKMCDKLSLNPVDFSSLERDASLGAQLLENRVMQNYVKLNQTGRDKILELMDDFVQIDKYKAKAKKTK